jgi:dephospho-CoA kinase
MKKGMTSFSPHIARPCFGLTGGIASGKSTVASFFSEQGARTVDADVIAHEILLSPGPAYDEVIEHFGREILDSSGKIDRRKLGELVFKGLDQRRALEAILHPRIIARQEEMVSRYLSQKPDGVALVEAALIYEAGISGRFLKMIVAWCRRDQQLERLMAMAHLSRTEAEARIAAQMPADEKRRRADYVIDCSGSLEETRRQVVSVYEELEQFARSAQDRSQREP